ncbi:MULTISPECIES: hypothetical protein [Chelatococcus]|uniref:Uncharacterized protein n=1 Tax=Chelatococcus caeni TaxID=1348468 RepID=A0A840C598_9HYPH|nr:MULTISPECIES: hypothetical protein [Chelatococcus]ALA16076.1 hypothetical protein AL346_00050 [Chelatococcus sp. CO-6]ALA19364.1 hypothetical protein AL346_20520 [Chelatococcus sp. CO-6]MBB4017577.1 hypothetical protein [Chelatococcus caeni]
MEIVLPLLASAALSGAGTVMSAREQNSARQRDAMARLAATDQEIQKQRKFQQEAADIFGNTMQRFTPEQQQATQQGETDKRTQALVDNLESNAPNYTPPISGSAPTIVGQTLADAMTKAMDRSKADATRLGKLLGSEGTMLSNSLGLTQGARGISTVNDFSNVSASLFPTRMESIRNAAFKQPSGFGDVLRSGGQLFAYGAGRGWFG